jgi:hypothetical protein
MTVSDTPSVDGDLEYGLTEFDQKLRHHCRYLKCRSRLPTPVVNHREAFCARGCHSAFYRHRCRVCEGPIEQKGGQQRLICRKAACRNAWQRKEGFGRYATSSSASIAQETPISCGSASTSKPVDRRNRLWRQIAGPPLTPSQLHCATIGGSAMDDDLRIEAKNRATRGVAEETEIEANGEFTESDWREIIIACRTARHRYNALEPHIR